MAGFKNFLGGGGGITALTGDVTASGTGSVAAALQDSANVQAIIAENVPLTTISGVLGADFTMTSATTPYTWLTTASFPVGKYLLFVNADLDNGASASTDIAVAVGTATATFSGPISASNYLSYTYVSLGFSCIVTVTVAGTLLLRGQSSVANTVVKQLGGQLGLAASGYMALLLTD